MMYLASDGAVGVLPAGLRSVSAPVAAGWRPVRGAAGAPGWAALARGGRLRAPWPLSVKEAPASVDLEALRGYTRAGPFAEAGLDGRGVTVAVIDLGFAGLDALPADRRPRSLRAVEGLSMREAGLPGEDHGTAVVAVLAAVAPGVTVLTAAVSDEAQLLEAMAALLSLRPDVVVASIGFDNRWPADGSSPASAALSAFVDETGAAWVAAAGNEHGRYRWGPLSDLDGDGRLEIGGLEGALINAPGGAAEARLRWLEPMGGSRLDLALQLETLGGDPCARADERQDGRGDPVEEARGACPDGAARAVIRWSGEGPLPALEAALYAPDGLLPGEETEGRELTLPADARGALSVGACRREPSADTGAASAAAWGPRPYSSRGPTEDGRAAPALCAPDGIALGDLADNGAADALFGSSASAPVVGGLLALALDARRRADPRAALEPVDLGPEGVDTATGEGLAQLGPPPCACSAGATAPQRAAGMGLWGVILGAVLPWRRRALA